MERSEIVYQIAANARARCRTLAGYPIEPASALVAQLCGALDIHIMSAPPDGVMLGGAYARLQLWSPDQPTQGGMVWVSQALSPTLRAFAIAHEIGHRMLHPGEGAATHTRCDQSAVDESADAAELRTVEHRVEEYTPRARRELEANAFAAELLAPRAQVRTLFARDDSITVPGLAAHFGISETLARRRLVDAVLAPVLPASAESLPAARMTETPATALLDRLDDFQRAAARAAGPALVVAGPGTGKTATLVGRVAHLVAERMVPPERVLALTFSNRAAGEMRERLVSSDLSGERMPVMTIHAFAASLLREYAPHVPCAPGEQPLAADFHILDEADAYLLMEELLGELRLRYYRSYSKPTQHLGTLRNDFSRACDGLHTPEAYMALVEAMPRAAEEEDGAHGVVASQRNKKPHSDAAVRTPGTFTAEEIGRARERAHAYAVWNAALRQRGLVDFGGLIQRAVELLRANTAVLADVRQRYPQILVDEFQDTNTAAAELLMLLAGDTGGGLWVVGDRNQAIYRWRGASPGNLRRLTRRYPRLSVHTLRRCYRSVPAIVDLGSAMAARMAELAAPAEDASEPHTDALRAALAPVTLEHVRPPIAVARPAVQRGETFDDATHERLGLAATMRRLHADGIAYRDQAALCRTRKQTEELAQALAASGLPVSQLGGYFEREEIKDVLALLALAVGPDTRGLLRATPLVTALGFPTPPSRELVSAIAGLKAHGRPLPGPLASPAVLAAIPGLSPQTRHGLRELGAVASELRYSPAIAPRLLEFLLRPRGYTWRLVRLAAGIAPAASVPTAAPAGDVPELPGRRSPQAERSLAALGELVRLVQRFDARWAREEDFRKRLSRAVFRVRRPNDATVATAKPLAQPDTLEPDPGADALPDAASDGASVPPELGDDEALPIRCFFHYLSALRESGANIAVPACDEDAVQVMTFHASKGLEFPVVYLPGLAQGQFPSTGGRKEYPSPPGFRENDSFGEKDAEERCLFYVGVTRARDMVVITRASHYAKRGTAQPSLLLGLLESAPSYLGAPSLLADAELAALQAEAQSRAASRNAEDDEQPGVISAEQPLSKPVFRLSDLAQYLRCPRQYKYASAYKLTDPAEDAVYRFHRYVRRGRGELARLRADQPRAGWTEANDRLRDVWTEVGPAGHAYERFYWHNADQILRAEWRALKDPALAAEAGTPATEPLRAELRTCVVEVIPERIIPSDAAGTTPAVLVRQHIGRESAEHRKDLALLLLYIAHQQQHPGVPVRIKLAYLGNVLTDSDADASPSGAGDVTFQHTVLDVTDEVRKRAELYFKSDRTGPSALDKLDRAAQGILARHFPVAPRDNACDSCPYLLTCPADPDDDSA
ncbi:MAG TPA: UvrD-helicase domain-containing protein [Ktedonobacterales bacterium]|nr:UvrD-helicase domain-containing protein [Ktedonobacterales bacterium]